jgi:hypothetical protein
MKISALAIGLLLFASAAAPGRAVEEPVALSFVDGATFFSQESKQERAIDPQVFIYDAQVAVGTGPQRIEHIAGLRNARLDDAPQAVLYNAEGKSLALTLKKWLAARGTLEVHTQPDGHDRVIASFKHLVPFGDYSLFVEIPGGTGKIARPLDSDGSASSFTARVDGSATIAVDGPNLSGDAAIVLVYHSDGREHGVSRGRLGVNAHEQLIAHM